MPNLRILPRNIGDTAALAASPVLASSLPVTNLQTQPRLSVARTTGVASQVIQGTWATNQRATMVALCRHNLTTAATWRVQLYSDVGLTAQIADSGTVTAFPGTGLTTQDDPTDVDARGMKNSVYYFALLTTVKGFKITITDAANPDGYFEASRLFIGEYFEPTRQPSFGAESFAHVTATSQARSDGGSLYSDRGADWRRETFDLDQLDATADIPWMLWLLRYCGKHRDVWFSFYPGAGNAQEIYHQGQFKFVDLGPLEPHFYNLHRSRVTLEEA
jgi:hypothetical protein